jgi:hypothetical protein
VKYDGAAIGYEFTFNIREANSAGVGLGLRQAFSRGPFTVGLGAGTELSRQNLRNFVISDTFMGLLTSLNHEECNQAVPPPRSVYPISGAIGLADVIATFVELNEMNVLSGKDPGKPPGKVPTLADTLTFETRVSASANPVVKLAPVGNHLQLVEASAVLAAERKDLHQVVVALTLPPEPKAAAATKQGANQRFFGMTTSRPLPPAQAAAAPGSTVAEERAIEELARQRELRYFENRRILNQSLGITDF